MLDALTFERMTAAAGGGPMLVALSGGGDSVALLHLLVEMLGRARLRAAVVDHALRPGSADDARRALALATGLGVDASIRTLAWAADVRPGQERAREGRYRALCEAARQAGALVIVTGHTRDDQAETVLLRAARGSGWRGLAGMRALAPAPVWPEGRGLRIARPLLRTRRLSLRALLQARAAAWIEDPANRNEDFARVRARRLLSQLETDGLPMRLAALAERLTTHAEALDSAALGLIRIAVRFEEGAALIARESWRGADAVRRRALSALVAAAAGVGGEPAGDQIVALEQRLSSPGFKGATLAGARLQERNGDAIAIGRDPGALSGRVDGAPPMAAFALQANVECVWDGRLALTAPAPGWSVVVDDGKPLLANGAARQSLAAVPQRWLLEERVEHLLQA